MGRAAPRDRSSDPPRAGNDRSVASSSDGSRLAAAGADETVRLWETTTWREVLTLRGPNHRIHAVAWGPDGVGLAAASADGKINLWHAAPVGP